MKKLLLIDGHNLLFKMFFGMPFPFYNDDNVNITGTVGFVGTVVKMIKYLKADECLVVFDGEGVLDVRKVGLKTMMGKMAEEMQEEEVPSPVPSLKKHLFYSPAPHAIWPFVP